MTIVPRPWVAALDPYVPGRPAGSEDGSLASNELALGASPAVHAAIAKAAARAHRYPDPLADHLRAVIADELGVGPDNILLGNGSDELIYLLVIAYAAMGGPDRLRRPALPDPRHRAQSARMSGHPRAAAELEPRPRGHGGRGGRDGIRLQPA